MKQLAKPPALADRLLKWFLAPHLLESVQGDLYEEFEYNLKRVGTGKARWIYFREVLGFLKLRYIKQNSNVSTNLFSHDMAGNYFKIAWRNLFRDKSLSAINISGLALGMSSALLIFLWVQDELIIGTQFKDAESLYRIMVREYTDGKVEASEDTPGLLADELKRQFPEILYAAGLSGQENHMLTVGEKSARHAGNFVGADWFKLYDSNLLSGRTDALQAPGSIAISRKLAENYFGKFQHALGRSIRFDDRTNFQVTAVFEDLPATSFDHYDFLLSWTDYLVREPWLKEWDNYGPGTRIRLRKDSKGRPADVSLLNAKLDWFLKGRDKSFGPTFHTNLFLKAEKDAYLYSEYKNGYPDGGRIEYVRLLGIIAGFLLLIAGINFMNLATARAARRAKEVGVRKVVGAARASLIIQFVSEAFLLSFLALILALGLLVLVLPVFNQLTGKTLHIPFNQPFFWLKVTGLLVATGLLAGSYPALFLSGYHPIRVLKGVVKTELGALVLRRGLVVFQFVMTMTMIVGTIVIYQQLRYIQTKNIGFDRENLISIPIEGELSKNYLAFKQKLSGMPGIQSVTHSYTNVLRNGNTTESVSWPGKDPNASISFHNTAVGLDYAKTLKLKFVKGRDFSPDFGSDSANYLINQAAAKRIGFKDPVGQPLTFWKKPGHIIGVIEDFHFNSLHEPIRPIIIRLANGHYGNIIVRTQPGETTKALAAIESECKKLNPRFPMNYTFVDSAYQKIYKSENIVGTLATIFACLAIFIACLGLFGLAAFTAEQRRKEIGVRKVLGASVSGIVAMLSGDTMKLVLVAVVISSPIGWYLTEQWLRNFEYHIDVRWWMFVLAGGLSTGVALITISVQSIKAALMNPVKSLKTE